MSLDLGALVGRVVLEDVQFQRAYVRLVRQFAELGGRAAAAAGGTDKLDSSLSEAATAGNAAATGLGRAQKAMTEAGVSASEAAAATGRQAAATTEAGLAASKLTQAQLRQLAAQERLNTLQASGKATTQQLASSEATLISATDRAAIAQERLGKATGFTSGAYQAAGRRMFLVGGLIAAGFAVAGHEAAQFDAELANIHALLGHDQAPEDMANLRTAALTAGHAYGYTAMQVADAEAELVKAGISVSDIMGGSLKGALTLAAAGQEDVAQATETAAIAMTQFQLKGKDVPHIADLLAAGADKALGSVSMLSEALKYGGLAASQAGFSIEETVGVLAEFAQAGLMGSTAGSALQMMLRNLQKPSTEAAALIKQYGITVYDSSGQMLSMSEIAGQLHDKIGSLPQAQRDAAVATLFTSRAVRAANILMREGAGATDQWTQTVNDAGFAAGQAAGKLDSLSGDATKLKASLQQALIGTGEDAQGPLRSMVQDVTHVVDAWNGLPAPVRMGAEALGGVTSVALLVGGGLLMLTLKIRETQARMVELGLTSEVMKARLASAASFMTGPWGIAIAAGVSLLAMYASAHGKAAAQVRDLTTAIEADSGAVGDNATAFAANALEQDAAGFSGTSYIDIAKELHISLSDLTAAATGNADAYRRVSGQFDDTSLRSNSLKSKVDELRGATAKAKSAAKDHADAVGKQGDAAAGATGEVKGLANAAGAAARTTRSAADAAKEYNDRLHALADPLFAMNKAVQDLRGKQHALNDAIHKYGANSRQARQAQLDMASSALDVAAASRTLTASVRDGTTSVSAGRRQLRGWVDAGLITESQARAVARSFGGLIDKAQHVSSELKTAAGSVKDAGRAIGFDFGAGMIIGLNDQTGPVDAAAAHLARSAAAGARGKKGMDSNSPSRVGHKIGGEFGTGVANGIAASTAAVHTASVKVAQAAIQATQTALQNARSNRASLSSSVSSSLGGSFDLSNATNYSAKGLTSFLAYGAHASERFNRLERRLIAKGLDPALVQQIAAEFANNPQAGITMAQNVLNGPAGTIRHLDRLEQRITRADRRTGQAVSKQQFGQQIDRLATKLDNLKHELHTLNHTVNNVGRDVRLEQHKSTVRGGKR